MFTRFSTVSTMEKVSGLRLSFPLSTLEISRISLISVRRWLLARPIFLRLSLTASRSPRFFSAIVVKPMIAFIGVRISWDMVERKSVFALLADSAFLAITRSILLDESIYRKSTTSSINNPAVTAPISSQSIVSAFRSLTGAVLSSTQPLVEVMGVCATMHSLPFESSMRNESVSDRISANSCCCAVMPGWL